MLQSNCAGHGLNARGRMKLHSKAGSGNEVIVYINCHWHETALEEGSKLTHLWGKCKTCLPIHPQPSNTHTYTHSVNCLTGGPNTSRQVEQETTSWDTHTDQLHFIFLPYIIQHVSFCNKTVRSCDMVHFFLRCTVYCIDSFQYISLFSIHFCCILTFCWSMLHKYTNAILLKLLLYFIQLN